MILIWEHDKLAGYFASLKNVKHGQSLGDWETIVKLVMNDLLEISTNILKDSEQAQLTS